MADNYKVARELASWKYKINNVWEQIEVKSVDIADGITNKMKIGQVYPCGVTIDLKGLSCNEVGVELVISDNEDPKTSRILETIELKADACKNNICCYQLDFYPNHPGSFNYGFRIFPKNENLPHRQDFKYVRWI